ncbi:hypothetical protein CEXT_315711 [Caerostris extrusa]|uniref:Uncharacterized protein n=1 Tax=Caerostris extrusa TaxID=172846 RepID=A0AAV4V6B9_CAEEX|nr:hypothetical protein CEXT_315711 [Caerostris extrusa]
MPNALQRSPSSYKIANIDVPQVPIGVYGASALKHFHQTSMVPPIGPLKKRGRPPTKTGQTVSTINAGSATRCSRRNQRGGGNMSGYDRGSTYAHCKPCFHCINDILSKPRRVFYFSAPKTRNKNTEGMVKNIIE